MEISFRPNGFEHGIDSYGKQRAKERKRPFLAETIVRSAL
jgi:hypothetical protein